MKAQSAFIALVLCLLGFSCSQDEPTISDEGSRTENTATSYDANFPVPVYTDADGYMHLDIDFDTYKYPDSKKLLANLKGKSWELEMGYNYHIYSDEKGGYQAILGKNPFFDVLGGYVQPKFQIIDEANANLYDRNFDLNDPAKYTDVIKPIKYTYDEKTGTLNLHFLHYWHVVLVNESELWLAGKGASEVKGVDNFTLYKLIVASPESVAEWNKAFKTM